MLKTSSYRDALLKSLTDPTEAAAYLNAGKEDSIESFLKALKNVAQARQMTKVAKDAGLQRETLYRSLSETGNPTLDTLSSILKAVGLTIIIQPDAVGEMTSTPPASTRAPVQTPVIAQRHQVGIKPRYYRTSDNSIETTNRSKKAQVCEFEVENQNNASASYLFNSDQQLASMGEQPRWTPQ